MERTRIPFSLHLGEGPTIFLCAGGRKQEGKRGVRGRGRDSMDARRRLCQGVGRIF